MIFFIGLIEGFAVVAISFIYNYACLCQRTVMQHFLNERNTYANIRKNAIILKLNLSILHYPE